jgi:hypothetical protein
MRFGLPKVMTAIPSATLFVRTSPFIEFALACDLRIAEDRLLTSSGSSATPPRRRWRRDWRSNETFF